jgi:hypothetical protein
LQSADHTSGHARYCGDPRNQDGPVFPTLALLLLAALNPLELFFVAVEKRWSRRAMVPITTSHEALPQFVLDAV